MLDRVLLLGANGFIGTYLRTYLANEYEVLVIDRHLGNVEDQIRALKPDIVINCSASLPNANFFDSLSANVLYQIQCLKIVSSGKLTPIKWVQVGSYFELQIEFGRKDNYSKHKTLCRTILEQADAQGVVDLQTIYLPHVFGSGENPKRIVPFLREGLQKDLKMTISSGEQYLPLLSVQDTCTAIALAIETDQEACAATPVWYGQVKELAALMQKTINSGSVILDKSIESVDAHFPPVQFPPSVKGWQATIKFEDFLHSLMVSG